MSEGEFTHFGDWCTFETLVHRVGIEDAAVRQMAEIIHDLDLKDRKYSRLEAAGVGRLVNGLCRTHPDDFRRLDAGFVLFDALHAALEETPAS